MTFGIAFLAALLVWLARGQSPLAHFRQPLPVWGLGIGGLFGYHALYFVALKQAPAAEASLIAYLWPLLIVLLSALLPGDRLRGRHIAGALAGFAGCAILMTGGGTGGLKMAYLGGYAAALACAVIWSSYSLASRRYGHVPTDAVGWFCGGVAVLGLLCHLAFEETRIPQGAATGLAILLLGAGPVGLAFFAWDIGVKHGDIRTLGVLSYAAPLISALLLVAAGETRLTVSLGLACLLITGGAVLARGRNDGKADSRTGNKANGGSP